MCAGVLYENNGRMVRIVVEYFYCKAHAWSFSRLERIKCIFSAAAETKVANVFAIIGTTAEEVCKQHSRTSINHYHYSLSFQILL